MKKYNFNEVVLVDGDDRELGTMEKMEAHIKGLLHRAFSVFIFNHEGQMLIQKRADVKYHSAGLWSNACCSHPAKNESLTDAAKRRLQEEIFLETDITPMFSFEYRAELERNLVEHELDHVLIGYADSFDQINPEEVSEMKFIDVAQLRIDVNEHPENYTVWFNIIMNTHWDKFLPYLKQKS
jgi:isopentenyl-diphosphate Delta-isomerase